MKTLYIVMACAAACVAQASMCIVPFRAVQTVFALKKVAHKAFKERVSCEKKINALRTKMRTNQVSIDALKINMACQNTKLLVHGKELEAEEGRLKHVIRWHQEAAYRARQAESKKFYGSYKPLKNT